MSKLTSAFMYNFQVFDSAVTMKCSNDILTDAVMGKLISKETLVTFVNIFGFVTIRVALLNIQVLVYSDSSWGDSCSNCRLRVA